VRPRQTRLRRALQALVALYVLAIAGMPFAHHDLVCHIKSNTHCGTCHVGTSSDPSGAKPSPATPDLVDAGDLDVRSPRIAASCVLSPSVGRAPPASLTTSVL
jgi:hypothetical protein